MCSPLGVTSATASVADLVGVFEHNCKHRRALKRYVPGLQRGPHSLPGACEIVAAQVLRLHRLHTCLPLQILTSRGIEIGKLSAIPFEEEILLPAGTVLKITGVLPKDASGQTIVTLEDDENAPELIL
eukprot:COSAG02_NODE_3116_length_7335_cov_2.441680_1_plen_128_part_00